MPIGPWSNINQRLAKLAIIKMLPRNLWIYGRFAGVQLRDLLIGRGEYGDADSTHAPSITIAITVRSR